jgi:hypothetical protein
MDAEFEVTPEHKFNGCDRNILGLTVISNPDLKGIRLYTRNTYQPCLKIKPMGLIRPLFY